MPRDAHAGTPPLRALNDPEGAYVPHGLPTVVDAHVHVFPDALFETLRAWFDAFAWPIRYRMRSEEVVGFLLSRGIRHVVAFQFAHRPGMARSLNDYMVRLVESFPGRLTGLATVYPGEDGCREILEEAFSRGLAGVKLHAHVQCFDMNGKAMEPVYETCERWDRPLVMHASREPKSPAYRCDPHEICGADRVEAVLREHPRTRLCVPHLGVDEFGLFRDLAFRYDNLWLDTAMVLAGYFPVEIGFRLDELRSDRVMYGSDFPDIPYAWDRELSRLAHMGLSPSFLERLLSANAAGFFGLDAVAGTKNAAG